MPGSLFNLGRYVQKSSAKTDVDTGDTNSDKLNTAETVNTTQETKTAESVKTTKSTNPENPQLAKTDAPISEKQTTDPFQKQANIDILSRLTQRTNKCLVSAISKAKEYKVKFAESEYVLWGLLQDSGVYQIIAEQKVSPSEIIKEIEASFKQGSSDTAPQFSPRVKKALEYALETARKAGYEFVSPEHLIIGLLQEGEGLAAQIMTKHGVTAEGVRKKQGLAGSEGEKDQKEQEKNATEEYCIDITERAKSGKLDPVVGRSKEIERVMHILSRRTKNNPVLIGEAGVGKTAIVEGLAQRIASGNVPEPLKNKRILSLDLMSLIAGASHRGDFEKRFKKLLSELEKSQGTAILFIDELHNLVGAGGSEGAMDASNMIKPLLARGELQTIGTTTVIEYRKHIEKDRAFERRFQPVLVNEPTAEQAIEMLSALKNKYETFHKVSISDTAVEAAVRLSARYIGDRYLPDKAIDLIDEAASAVRMPAISLPEEIQSLQKDQQRISAELAESEKTGNTVSQKQEERNLEELRVRIAEKTSEFNKKKAQTTSVVTPEIIQDIVSRWTGIPISRLTESESEKLTSLEDKIHEKLINQEEAVSAVSEAVRRGRAGFTSKKRPIGSFIFMGPTGVGKTELAKTLAEILFGSSELMIRIDMTEYMEKHEVAKLIGAPPGYVGYEEGGQLTEAVRRKPYSVVLLDEIEKAHPDVFNILLQILDDGRLTDNKGRLISFKNTILVCTSNVGTKLIQDAMLASSSLESVVNDTIGGSDAITTYAITPRGRELVTKKSVLWERQQTPSSENSVWKQQPLSGYFTGHVVSGFESLSAQAFPNEEFSTHTVSPAGEEYITAKDRLWMRTSTTAQTWKSMPLAEYIQNTTVVNAAADSPDDQIPTGAWETHTITPSEGEIITSESRVWIRDSRKNPNWKVMSKSIYIKEIQATGDTIPDDGRWNQHVFTPSGEEIILSGTKGWLLTGGLWKNLEVPALFAGDGGPIEVPVRTENKGELSPEAFAKLSVTLTDELRKLFRPELLNRFDEILVFKPLSAKHMRAIVEIQVKALFEALSEQGFGLEVSDSAKQELAIEGFDPIYGARPLRRTIQRMVENPIASLVIQGKALEGTTIVVDYDKEKGAFSYTVNRPVTSSEQTETQASQNTSESSPQKSVDTAQKGAKTVQELELNGTEPAPQKPSTPPNPQKIIADELAQALQNNESTPSANGQAKSEVKNEGTETQPTVPHFNDMYTQETPSSNHTDSTSISS